MKEEIQRISRLVAEGKLSPEDGAELIEAFVNAGSASGTGTTPPPPPPPPSAPKDPFKELFDKVDKVAKENLNKVDWKELGGQIESGARKGIDAIKTTVEDLAKGKINLNLFGIQETREVNLPLNIASGKRLRIENPCGNVVILGSAESGTVLADARFRAATVEEAKAHAAEYTLIIEEGDGFVLIRQPDVPGLSVDLTVRIPEAVVAEVRTEAGDISISGNAAGARISSRSGNVALRGANGPIEIAVDSGDVIVENTESPSLALDSKSGTVRLAAIRGNVNARSAGGDLQMTSSAGKVIALETVSGSVSVELIEPVGSSLSVRTVSGDVTLDLPDGNDCRVSLSSLRGDVTSQITLTDEAKAEGRLTGKLGIGTGSLDVSAVTGSVSLRLRNTATV